MLKKLFFIFGLLMATMTSTVAQIPVDLKASYVDPSTGFIPRPRTPICPPCVFIEEQTLTFAFDHPEYVLYIKDENDVVVYTTVVNSAVTQVTLPSPLSGDYKIELVMGNWLFTGYINL